MPWLLHNLFTVIFERKHLLEYLKKLSFYFAVIFMSCIITYFICTKIKLGLLMTFLVRGIVCLIIPNLIYLIAYKSRMEFKDSLALVNHMTKGKFKGILSRLGMSE